MATSQRDAVKHTETSRQVSPTNLMYNLESKQNKKNKEYKILITMGTLKIHYGGQTKVRSFFFEGTIQLEIVLHNLTLTHPAIKFIPASIALFFKSIALDLSGSLTMHCVIVSFPTSRDKINKYKNNCIVFYSSASAW